MISISLIPILYPLMPKELPVKILSENGIINSIYATINNEPIEFVKNSDGNFAIDTKNQLNKLYLDNILSQLNRMFAN